MNPAFHSLIGGIEAVIHFIEKRSVDPAGRLVPSAPDSDSDPVKSALNDLREVKLALLDAECDFMTAIANHEHIPGKWLARHSGDTPPPSIAPVDAASRTITGESAKATPAERQALLTQAREEWELSFDSHCAAWVAALNAQTQKFANAIYSLQLQAPEWGLLDRRLARLMEDFKHSAEWKAGAGDTSGSWPSIAPPSSSSSG